MIGFLATTGLPDAIQLGGLVIFTIIVAFHGVLFFVLHTIRSKVIRQQCIRLYRIVTCRKKPHQNPGSIGTSSQLGTTRRVSVESTWGTLPTGLSSTRRTSTSSTTSASSDFGTLRPQIPPSLAEVPEEEVEVEEESCRLSPQPEAAMESTTGGRGSLVLSNVALTEELEQVDLEAEGRGSLVLSNVALTEELEQVDLEAEGRDSLVIPNVALEISAVGQDEGEGDCRDSSPSLSSV